MRLNASVKVRSNRVLKKIRGVKTATDEATWSAAGVILTEAQRRVRRGKDEKRPEVTVHDSLTIVGKKGDDTVMVGSVGAHRNRPVARFLEGGTHRQHARPFLRPAAALGRKRLKEEATARLRAELEGS